MELKTFILAALVLGGLAVAECYVEDYDPYWDLNLKPVKTSADRIREHGYPAEVHRVETSDNYILTMFRIPHSPRLNNENEYRPAIFIQHGLFSCSDCFLLNGPDNALAYNLVDAGFDVWLGNARGNIYSRNNSVVSVNHPYFWRFSWHEIGTIDLPEMIDYIIEKTGQSKIHYAGHSQGGTSFYVMTSMRPEYNDKIKTAHLLAPAGFMGNCTNALLKLFEPLVGKPGKGSLLLEDQEFMFHNQFVNRVLDTACGGKSKYPIYCRNLFFTWAGHGNTNLNTSLLTQIAETHPAGVSSNQGIHYIQGFDSNEFRQFDFGPERNMQRYGQIEPPNYPLENISAGIYMYYSFSDASTDYRDVERIRPHLKNLKNWYFVEDLNWEHIDFIFALKVKETINDKVVNFCLAYENGEEPETIP
uniref:Lipase n=2 Tax=Stomoxys calcitrans TaxID=35570 RepID=A0A1I8Q1M7_STOCA